MNPEIESKLKELKTALNDFLNIIEEYEEKHKCADDTTKE